MRQPSSSGKVEYRRSHWQARGRKDMAWATSGTFTEQGLEGVCLDCEMNIGVCTFNAVFLSDVVDAAPQMTKIWTGLPYRDNVMAMR